MLKIAQVLKLDESQVEEQLIGDEKFELIDEFFESTTLKKLVLFFQVSFKDKVVVKLINRYCCNCMKIYKFTTKNLFY